MRNRSLVEREGREGGVTQENEGRGGVGGEKRGRRSGVKKAEVERGRRGKSDSQNRGAVLSIATGNRPSYVH